jgi:hypothetical protein
LGSTDPKALQPTNVNAFFGAKALTSTANTKRRTSLLLVCISPFGVCANIEGLEVIACLICEKTSRRKWKWASGEELVEEECQEGTQVDADYQKFNNSRK